MRDKLDYRLFIQASIHHQKKDTKMQNRDKRGGLRWANAHQFGCTSHRPVSAPTPVSCICDRPAAATIRI